MQAVQALCSMWDPIMLGSPLLPITLWITPVLLHSLQSGVEWLVVGVNDLLSWDNKFLLVPIDDALS